MPPPDTSLQTQVLSPQPSTGRIGLYELLARVTAGGMGEVFIARRAGALPTQRVALKVLLPHLAQQPFFVQLFLDEARTASRMSHPNIVQVFDVGQADGRYFIAMSLVEGVSLGVLLRICRRKQIQLPFPIVRLIARGLCDALQYAHTLTDHTGAPLNIVHRDVSPHNVLISSAGAVMLTDFGIAKAEDNLHTTRPGDVRGKYAYMAPEQLGSHVRVDGRADVFSAAATLFETYTLVSPFSRPSDPDTIDAIRQAPLPDPRRFRRDISPDVADALMRGLARDPAERYHSALELREALLDGQVAELEELGQLIREHFSEQLEVFQQVTAHAHQHPDPPRSARNTKRARWALPAQAAGATLLTGALTFGAWQFLTSRNGNAPLHAQPAEVASALASRSPVLPVPVTPEDAASAPKPDPTETVPLEPLGAGATSPMTTATPEQTQEPRKSRARQQVQVGYVTADASPWAQVWVDGREVERTPISRYPLPPGEHQLRFRNPDLGKEVRRKVRVEPGKVVRVRVEF
ncbi:MAG TPA: serine/threonine-protein kinase [Myxococcaceae bacterium]|nr:serine/threonine-protein kinase [Myxococcaceae bacterium]